MLLLILLKESSAQEVALESWLDQLPYNNAIEVAIGNNKTYCASFSGMFYLDNSNKEIKRFNLVSGLSDIGLSSMAFHSQTNKLIVGYINGNIDVIDNEDNTFNLSAIKSANLNANKSINDIYVKGDYAYLACGFGIVLFNVKKLEISDTYFLKQGQFVKVNSVTTDKNFIYAATNEGLYFANINSPNLAHHSSWQRTVSLGTSNYSKIVNFNNKLILSKNNKTFKKDTLLIRENNIWREWMTNINLLNLKIVSERLIITYYDFIKAYNNNMKEIDFIFRYPGNRSMLVSSATYNTENQTYAVSDYRYGLAIGENSFNMQTFLPQGPYARIAEEFDGAEDKIWVASGTIPGPFLRNGVYIKTGASWHSINEFNSKLLDSIINIVTVAVDPFNKNHAFFGSWGLGIVEFEGNQATKQYDFRNSNLPKSLNNNTVVNALNFDEKGNLWIGCGQTDNPLFVKPYGKKNFINLNIQGFEPLDYLIDIIFDDFGRVWFISSNKLKILDYNNTFSNTTDDIIITEASFDGTPLSIHKEKDGEIWLGTTKGLFVYYEIDNLRTIKAERILITQNGLAQYLLENEEISVIKTDGRNRKWIGTSSSGIYLFNPNGQIEEYHFTTENSPLFSNNIHDLIIQPITGEILISTDKGMLLFKSTSTEPLSNFNIEIYPNPVKLGFNGKLAIRGLLDKTDVRITDIAGNLIYKTESIGGQAIWNIKNINGEKAKPGIYLVFCINKNGTSSRAGKFTIVR